MSSQSPPLRCARLLRAKAVMYERKTQGLGQTGTAWFTTGRYWRNEAEAGLPGFLVSGEILRSHPKPELLLQVTL